MTAAVSKSYATKIFIDGKNVEKNKIGYKISEFAINKLS